MAFLRSGWAVVLANILVPLGILVFSSGFFPYKPLLPGLATFDEIDQNATPAIFDKVIFMVVDALRRYVIKQKPGSLSRTGAHLAASTQHPTKTVSSDFVYSNESGFSFTQRFVLFPFI
jgi:ethanolaminephosphotransferase